jgi:hypothetical protein
MSISNKWIKKHEGVLFSYNKHNPVIGSHKGEPGRHCARWKNSDTDTILHELMCIWNVLMYDNGKMWPIEIIPGVEGEGG